MRAVLFLASGALCGITSSISPARRKIGIYEKDGTLLFGSQRSLLQPSCLSTKSEGDRRAQPRKTNPSDSSEKARKLKDVPTSDSVTPRTSSQEEIIAVFRRIQSSISKGGSAIPKRGVQNSLSNEQSAESVLGNLNRYPRTKQEKARRPKADNGLHQSSGNMDDRRPGNVEVQRPVSNFVKKSPILAPPSKERAMNAGEESAPMTDTNVEYELHKLDEMKLSELKELAKTKGAKRYSKLKKGELLELLRGILQSSS